MGPAFSGAMSGPWRRGAGGRFWELYVELKGEDLYVTGPVQTPISTVISCINIFLILRYTPERRGPNLLSFLLSWYNFCVRTRIVNSHRPRILERICSCRYMGKLNDNKIKYSVTKVEKLVNTVLGGTYYIRRSIVYMLLFFLSRQFYFHFYNFFFSINSILIILTLSVYSIHLCGVRMIDK